MAVNTPSIPIRSLIHWAELSARKAGLPFRTKYLLPKCIAQNVCRKQQKNTNMNWDDVDCE